VNWEMDRRMTPNWWLLAVIACTALAADPSLAAWRGRPAPQLFHGVTQDAHSSHEVASPASQLTNPVVTDIKTDVDRAGSNSVHSEPSAAHSPTSVSGKSAGTPHLIDLVRADDGYANLRRRAARPSLISAGQKKKPQIVTPVAVVPPPPSPAGATERARNSAGMPMPAKINFLGPDAVRAVTNEPANAGPAKNSLGLTVNHTQRNNPHVTAASTTAPVMGINGSSMGHVGTAGIGGPAKERSAIGGSSFRRF
jgi:hypothetical protein